MKWLRAILFGALAMGFLLAPACVELTGQRITWFHDQQSDTLYLLIHYDGIHEAHGKDRRGVEQIPAFVDNGDVMLFDWPFHLDRKRIRELAQTSREPLDVEWGRVSAAIDTETLGHYREPDGRIGAAQLVTIRRASEVLRQINAAISLAIENDRGDGDLPRTLQRIRQAAAERHQWISLDGHAIRISVPVHAGEWAQAKGTFLRDLLDNLIREHAEPKKGGVSDARTLLEAISSAPLSYIDEGHRVTFVLGRRDRPTTLRMQVRDEYERSLEDVVTDAVPLNLDAELARRLLDPDVELPAELAQVLSWGPPEDQVRALLTAAAEAPISRRRVIAERLARWAEQWNREQGVPEARLEVDPDELAASWASWYQQVKRQPPPR